MVYWSLHSLLLTLSFFLQTFGVIRVPLLLLGDGVRGFPVFLSNKFAGNARAQMVYTLRKLKIVPEAELDALLKVADEYALGVKPS